MRVDLHTHTTASDGSLAPADLVRAARFRRPRCDRHHRSRLGRGQSPLPVLHASRAPARCSPGCRALGGSRRHRRSHPRLLHRLSRPGSARRVLPSSASVVTTGPSRWSSALREAGYDVTLDDVLVLAEGGSVGRSHVAKALVGGGHAESVSDAFERLIGRGRPFYVPKPVAEPPAVVDTIISAGGVPVLAHPASPRSTISSRYSSTRDSPVSRPTTATTPRRCGSATHRWPRSSGLLPPAARTTTVRTPLGYRWVRLPCPSNTLDELARGRLRS